jgi:hypothetical protein
MVQDTHAPPVTMEIVTDPVELAKARARHERFRRNLAWYQAHTKEIFGNCRGKYICIAGEQLFVGESAQAVLAQARAAHPEDDGFFLHYIQKEKAERIYAALRTVSGM